MSKHSPIPYSYSKVKAFETCALQYYNDKVLRRYPRAETEAILYGKAFHEAAEFYIRDGTPLPGKFQRYKKLLDALNVFKGKKLTEFEMGITENLAPCEFNAEDVWWRGICDLNIMNGEKAFAIDYKTGSLKSLRYADMGQLELMALGVFAHFPEVQKVKAGLLYVVANKMIKDTFVRDDVPKLWQKWIGKFNAMKQAYDNNIWNPKTSGLCRAHCPVMECPHNGRS